MRLFKKTTLIIVILAVGILVTFQTINKNKVVLDIKPKDTYEVNAHNQVNLISSKLNNAAPNLTKKLEPLANADSSSSSLVLYSSPNRTLKRVALTFDDGPDAYYTPQILGILKQNNIKATFFIVGLRAQSHPDMVRRIISEGHAIGNHTWDHPVLSKLTTDKVKEQVQRTEQLLYNITGSKTAMFRTPYGSTTPQVINEISSLGYKIIDWSVDTRDWAKTPVPQIMDYVSNELYPGGIILKHCSGSKSSDLSNTVKALPQIISLLKSRGYSFVMVQDLLDIPNSK